MSSTPPVADTRATTIRTATIRTAIDRAAVLAGHSLDAEQAAAADALARFGARLSARRPGAPGGGLYLWGSVGRGKTWLADALFAALVEALAESADPAPVRRLHFHAFYRGLHADLYQDGPPEPGAIDAAIDRILGDDASLTLLYFDEFHLHDAGDATLALRVLRRLVERRVSLLATSNYPPANLLPDEMFHHLFEPGIRLIEDEFEVVSLDGSIDYRRLDRDDDRREGFARGSWHHSTARSDPDGTPVELRAGGHRLTARTADATQLRISFDELCERPTAAADYLAWAERWPRWVIDSVPRLTTCSPQARQRFLNLVDVLNDRGIDATFVSDFTPEQVLEGGPVPTARGAAADRGELGLGIDGLPIDVARTASRLALLRRGGHPARD